AVSNREEIDWDESEKTSDSTQERAFIHSLRILRGIADHGAPLSRIELAPGFPAGADDPSALPQSKARATWGHLVLLEKVGHGSYGEVYRAWDPKLSTDVALKLIPCPFSSTEEALREGRMLARVHHPNVARVFGADRIGETVGVWMEYVDGLTLKDIARDEAPLLPGMLLPIAQRLLEALAAIHDAKIVHRDLKPENVLVDKMGRVVVTDFGCGAFRTEADAGRRAQFAGTPRFMAPELFAKEEPTPSSDLYALGVILFHLATGKYPVEATSVAELQSAHRSGRRELLSSSRPDLPRSFVDAVDKTLDPDPRRRHRSAREWLDAITGTQEKAASPKPAAARRLMRSRLAIAGAALAAIAVGAWATFASMNGPLRFDAQMLRSRDNGAWMKLDNAAIASSDAVQVGDRLMLAFDSDRKTYVYVINWDDEGRAYLLFPMRSSELHNPLAPGDEHHLPGTVGGEPFAWEVSSAGGREHFAIVASRDRLAEFERLVGTLESVAVDAQKELSPSAFDGLLRGVGRATSFKGRNASGPEEILRNLEKQIQSDSEMKRRVALRVITVQSDRG
ncbi:MAG TPA: serine/threonine-protein kinase, partial [bacterium]|nr:serine/threonine-protein kinase [bacterium]